MFHHTDLGKSVLVIMPKPQTTKATMNQWDCIQAEQLLRAKTKLVKGRDNSVMGGDIYKV